MDQTRKNLSHFESLATSAARSTTTRNQMNPTRARGIPNILEYGLVSIAEHPKNPVSRHTPVRVMKSYQTRYPETPSPARASGV